MYMARMGIRPAKNATKSGPRARSPGAPMPSAMPTIGASAKRTTRATLPISILLGLEEVREPGAAQARDDDPRDPEQDDNGLGDVLGAHRAHENRLAAQVRAGRVELLADQGVVARRDKERELGRIGLARDLDRAGGLPC